MRRFLVAIFCAGCGMHPFDAPREEREEETVPGVSMGPETSLALEESWTSLGAPAAALEGCQAYWTGTQLLLWSGDAVPCAPQRLGADGWSEMIAPSAPTLGTWWAGTARGRLVVYGHDGMDARTALYDPESDSWSEGASYTMGKAPHEVRAISADTKVLMWGGYDGALGEPSHMELRFAKYDPEADVWQPMSELQMPPPRYRHGVVWDSHHMFVIGGYDYAGNMLADGGVYDEGSDAWEPISTIGAPSPRLQPAVAWSGYFYVVFGGTLDGETFLPDGGVYCPEPCWEWQPMTAPGDGFTPRHPQALWTGEHVVVLQTTDAPLAMRRYLIESDTWEPIATPDALADFVVLDVHFDWTQHRALLWGRHCPSGAASCSGPHAVWAYHPPFVIDPDDGHPGDNLAGNQTHR